jgi:hypothetical protein
LTTDLLRGSGIVVGVAYKQHLLKRHLQLFGGQFKLGYSA